MNLKAALAVDPASAQAGYAGEWQSQLDRESSPAASVLDEVRLCAAGISQVEPTRLITRALAMSGTPMTVGDLREQVMRAAADLIAEEPAYSHLACRLLSRCIDREVTGQGVHGFLRSVQLGHDLGRVNQRLLDFVTANAETLSAAIDAGRSDSLEYFGLRTLYERYLHRCHVNGPVCETPQYFWMRIAASLSDNAADAIEMYRLFSSLDYLPSDETLLHAGTTEEHLSSCYLLESPRDSAESIADRFHDIDLVSKSSADVAIAWHRTRTEGSITHAADSMGPATAMRRGTTCVYLEPWHPDIETFLDLQQSGIGDDPQQQPLTLANWIPDLFMRRVEANEDWSLFDPADVPLLPDLFGEEFEKAYELAESRGLARKTVPARDLYAQMIRTIVDSGHGWMEFKDNANRASNQTAIPGNMIHASNICTEILEVTSNEETAVCNLGAINLANHVTAAGFDFDKLATTVRAAIRQLDRAIDLNFYPLPAARMSSERWRPVGLGIMGLQDVFFRLRLPFDGYDARELSTRIAEAIYFHALDTSLELARAHGAHASFADTRVARGELQFDAWGVQPSENFDWPGLRERIREHGLRNSLLVAIGPTASIASIAGCFECIEPQISNFFQRETRGGDFVQVNPYLVEELKQLGLWTDATRTAIRLAGGSIQSLYQLPVELRTVFRTAWELSTLALIDLAADRGAYVDQSQSLSLFMTTPNVTQIARMYMYAWKCGLKTTYALHSRWPHGAPRNATPEDSLATN